MKEYKCKFCGVVAQKEKEDIKYYKCKSCGKLNIFKKQDVPEIIKSDIQDININLSDESLEPDKSEDVKFKVENLKVEIPQINIPTGEPVKPTNSLVSNSPPTSSSGFTPDTVGKYFNAIDKMMVKKAGQEIWDVGKDEEKLMGELWASYGNDKFKEMKPEQNKLLSASIVTGIIYLPRVVEYTLAVIDKKKKERTNKKEQTTLKVDEVKPEIKEEIKTPDVDDKKFAEAFAKAGH